MQIIPAFRSAFLRAFVPLCCASAGLAQVAVMGAPASLSWSGEVTAKIAGSGVSLGTIATIDVQATTPTLTELQAYRAVLVYSDTGFLDDVQFGNNLKDYVDGGGGVVIAVFASASVPLAGAWASSQYDAILPLGQTQGTQLQLGTRHLPAHPLFTVSTVASFDGGTSSYMSTGSLAPNSVAIADWTDGSIFAAERVGLAGRVLGLNFFPPSSDSRPDFWDATTDGDNLLANALAYAGRLDCGPAATYCTPKVNSLGCTPSIAASGAPSATAPSGFVVTATNVRNMKVGLLLYGVSGRNSSAFAGGFLCEAMPVRRSTAVSSGGTPLPASDCSGVYSLDMNAFAQGNLGGAPLLALRTPGTVVDCQWWGLDPGYPFPNNATLSQALEYVVCQ